MGRVVAAETGGHFRDEALGEGCAGERFERVVEFVAELNVLALDRPQGAVVRLEQEAAIGGFDHDAAIHRLLMAVLREFDVLLRGVGGRIGFRICGF